MILCFCLLFDLSLVMVVIGVDGFGIYCFGDFGCVVGLMILVSFGIYKLEFLGASALGFGFLWVGFMVCLGWFLF